MTVLYENELEPGSEQANLLEELDPLRLAGDVIREALDVTGCPYEAAVSLLVTDEDSIREMNRETRGIDSVTDVLSFPLLEYDAPGDFSFLGEEEGSDLYFDPDTGELSLGDIVICWPRCISQAKELGHSVRREFAFLTAHSILHLTGYDHVTKQQEEEMFSLQERILQKLGIARQ